MSRLEALLRLSLVRAELVAIAEATDDEQIQKLIHYVARLLEAKT